MRERARVTAAIAAIMALGGVVPARADVFNDFRRNGTINPCKYSDGQLRKGLQGLPPDVQQYAPGLADQLAAGREGCGGGGGGGGAGQPTAAVPVPSPSGGAPPPPPTAPTPAAPKIRILAPPAPKATVRSRLADIDTPTVTTGVATGAKTPDWLLPLLVSLSLGAVLLAFARFWGYSPERFTRPLKASLSEAGGRTADAFAQLRDVVRLGR